MPQKQGQPKARRRLEPPRYFLFDDSQGASAVVIGKDSKRRQTVRLCRRILFTLVVLALLVISLGLAREFL